MKTGKMILLLGSVLGVFTILTGCNRVDTSNPNATPKPTSAVSTTPTATVSPAVTTSPTKEIINITDDFSTKKCEWKDETNFETGDYSRYSSDAYAMYLSGKGAQFLAVPFKSQLDADKGYDIQVDVINSTADNAGYGGLFFNSSGSEGGILVIDPKNQSYAIQNGWSSLKWTEDKRLIPTTGTYTLKVEVRGTKVTVKINRDSIGTISVPQHLGETVGLYFASTKSATLTYDNFILNGTEYSSN